MTRSIQSLALAAVLAVAFAAALVLAGFAVSSPARAMGIGEPAKPADASTDKKDEKKDDKPAAGSTAPGTKPADANPGTTGKPADKKSDLEFRDGYKQAYAAIYERQDYSGAIAILHRLGHDDHPDVANLIGFSSRKLGRTADAKVWYEKALAADPKHVRTWQYYGMWQLERGNRGEAVTYLERIRLICGQGCEEYTSLRDALNGDGMTY